MIKLLINSSSVRPLLIVAFILYTVASIFSFGHYTGLRRFVTIERKTLGGVVLIDKTKYPTPYVLEQTRIGHTISGPIEYLLLSSGEDRQSFISFLCNIAFALAIIVFLWKLNFSDAYHWADFGRAYLAYRLFITTVLFNWITDIYTQSWVGEHLLGPDNFYYYRNASVPFTCFTVILITAMLVLYGRAIKSKEELDLTI